MCPLCLFWFHQSLCFALTGFLAGQCPVFEAQHYVSQKGFGEIWQRSHGLILEAQIALRWCNIIKSINILIKTYQVSSHAFAAFGCGPRKTFTFCCKAYLCEIVQHFVKSLIFLIAQLKLQTELAILLLLLLLHLLKPSFIGLKKNGQAPFYIFIYVVCQFLPQVLNVVVKLCCEEDNKINQLLRTPLSCCFFLVRSKPDMVIVVYSL